MDPAAELPKPENIEPEEVLIPKEVATALGRGLSQLLKEPAEQIRKHIENLRNNPQVNQAYLQRIEKPFSNLTAISNNLEQAKETRIIPAGTLWAFKFSEDKEMKDLTIQAEVIVDEMTAPKLSQLRIAMADSLNNSLAGILGFSELLQSSTEDSNIRQQVTDMHSISQSIFRSLIPIQTADYQLRILTSPDGNTTIAPAPNPHAHPNDMSPS